MIRKAKIWISNISKGQALALRGWAYFDLARLYQQTYAIAKDMPGVPIYTEPTVDGTQGKPRGTWKNLSADLVRPDDCRIDVGGLCS